MDAIDKKRYNQMENVLIKINEKYISLPEDEIKRNNKILEQVTEHVTTLMKEKDVLFRSMYERKFYGGSYYDKIKVGKPEEYDLDCILNLPLIIEPTLQTSDKPGFVNIYIKEYMKMLKRDEAPKFEKLDTLMDSSNYLSTSKVLQWMEGTLNLALNELKKDSNGSFYNVHLGKDESIKVYTTLSKAHPAFTLKLKDENKTFNFDVDLVPCFQFTNKKWPQEDYRKNPFPTLRDKFLVVPKKPHGMDDTNIDRYWRLSFQEQERELIKGEKLRNMKPSIKLLKKLRDKQNHIIASYYIKTLFLWEVRKQTEDFWRQPLSCVFITMLKKYAEVIKNKNIPYFWNEKNNLIGHLKEVALTGIGNQLKNIIDDVENHLEDPFVIARYLVNQEELEQLMKQVNLGKKHKKNLIIANCVRIDTPSKNDSVDSAPTEDEKIKKLVTDKEFVQEIAKHIARYLEPKLNFNSQSSSSSDESFSGRDSAEKTNEIITSLNGLHTENSRLIDMITELRNDNQELVKTCNALTHRLCNLEGNVADLSLENSKLRSKENVQQTSVLNSVKNHFADFDRLSLTASSLHEDKNDACSETNLSNVYVETLTGDFMSPENIQTLH